MFLNSLRKISSALLWIAARAISPLFKKGRTITVITGALRGSRIRLHNSRNDINAFSGRWKTGYLRILSKLIHHRVGLHKDAIIFNVGAGHGFSEIFMNRRLAGRCRIYSFEPAADAQNILAKNLMINHIENTEIIKKAVSHKIGMIEWYEAQGCQASVIPARVPGAGAGRLVPTTTLDIFCKRNNMAPALIHLNINGGAELALEGTAVTIEKYHPLMFVEVHTAGEQQAVAKIVRQFGYEVFVAGRYQWVKSDDREEFFEQPFTGGLLLSPGEMKEDINYALFNKYRRDPGVAEKWTAKPAENYALN